METMIIIATVATVIALVLREMIKIDNSGRGRLDRVTKELKTLTKKKEAIEKTAEYNKEADALQLQVDALRKELETKGV